MADCGFIFIRDATKPNLFFYPHYQGVLFWLTGRNGQELIYGQQKNYQNLEHEKRRLRPDYNSRMRVLIFNRLQEDRELNLEEDLLKILSEISNSLTLRLLRELDENRLTITSTDRTIEEIHLIINYYQEGKRLLREELAQLHQELLL